MITNVLRFVQQGIWEIPLSGLSPAKAFFIRWFRVLLLALQGFMKNQGQKSVSVLTYYSMLNLVPIIGVAFGIAKGFGLEKLIESRIQQMAREANWQVEITDQILGFSRSLLDHVKGGLIAGIGVILLFWTVISIFGKIEDSLNTIWEVKKPRTLIRKFSDYLTMMVLAPVLFIISSSVTVLVASQIKGILQKISLLGAFSSVILFLLNLLPYVSTWALFVLLYIIMPNTRVPLRSAIVGGVAAGTIYQLVQWIYIKFQIGAANYGAIYGSFAALPLFLVWLQLSWTIVLFGAEIAFAHEHHETFGFHPDYTRLSADSRKVLMLRIFHFLAGKFSRGEPPPGLRGTAHTLRIPLRLTRQILSEMAEAGLVAEITRGKTNEAAFQPGRSIENLTILRVLRAYEGRGDHLLPPGQSGDAQPVSLALREMERAMDGSPSNVRVKEIGPGLNVEVVKDPV